MVDWWTHLNNLIYAIVTALVGAFVLLVRKILTNEKQIALLKQEIVDRNRHREENDKRVDNILTELRNDVKDLLKHIR